ncbi:nucleoside deaminase [Bifidobacterium psychraerophilum]|uniref:nucleoside deaminase n=1 Tax=Bifidobacterium psychraerophilum TaxID=218140 RepID=UPI0039E96054
MHTQSHGIGPRGDRAHGTPWDDAMCAALDLATQAAEDGDVPVGAVVLDGRGEIIGSGRNQREALGDPLAHAEVVALRQAAGQGRDSGWNLSDMTLVVTLEPCPMCAGAALATHIGRIVFGAWDPKMGACGSVWDLPRDPHTGPMPEVIGGVQETRCMDILNNFFRGLR